MLELEPIQSEECFEKFLSELKPVTPITWDKKIKDYTIDKNENVIAEINSGFENLKQSLRDIYSFGQTIRRGTPKFCLALNTVYRNLKYVEDTKATCDNSNCYSKLGLKPSMDYGSQNESFAKLVGRLGLSDTAAYAYRDLGYLVDPATNEFYPKFIGYSVSLLIEMTAYVKKRSSYVSRVDLEELTEVIPCDTTVEKVRNYRKIMELWRSWKIPFEVSSNHCQISGSTPIDKVIEIYDGFMQEAESTKLLKLVKSTENTTTPKPEELIGNDILIKSLRQQVEVLKAISVPNLGKCDGCIYKDNNLNKCRCCRRYSGMKDLFKSE